MSRTRCEPDAKMQWAGAVANLLDKMRAAFHDKSNPQSSAHLCVSLVASK
jgi:hypothetical protein